MFQFPGCPPMRLFDSSHGDGTLLPPGFPIRISADQTLACSSPQLIAACYVLLRQSVPWHPPCALISLIYFLASLCFRRESLLIHIPSTSLRLVCFWFSLSLCSFQGAKNALLKELVGRSGLEPPTSRLSGVCSNQLSYQPRIWWRLAESNR